MTVDSIDKIKHAISSIRCTNLRNGELCSIGTAFLISDNLVMTARHNIEDYINDKEWIDVKLTFKCNELVKDRVTRSIKYIVYGEKEDEYDVAILELDKKVGNINPLNCKMFKDLNATTIHNVLWTTYGFPVKHSTTNLRTFEGYILDNSKPEKWDLDLRWNGLEQITSEGLSGAPLLIDGNVVGMLITELIPKLGAALGAVSTFKINKLLSENNIEISNIMLKEYHYKGYLDFSERIINKISNTKPSKNNNFVGREDILKKLDIFLEQKDVVVLIGPGGIGKTQIASQYLQKHEIEYDFIRWFNAEDKNNLEAEYIKFAMELGVSRKEETDSINDIVNLVNEKIKDYKKLYVFDNAKSSNELVQLLAQGNKSIITSRVSSWTGSADDFINIDEFKRDDSIEFIKKRTNEEDRDAANMLAYELGDYPLALEQASAYILNKKSMTITQYINRYKQLKEIDEVVLEKRLFSNSQIIKDYNKTLRNTLEITFNELKEESPHSLYLLNMCSLLSPELIPVDLFIENKDLLCEEITGFEEYKEYFELDFEEYVIDPLIKYSLINYNIQQKGFQIHRMIQQITRINLIEISNKKVFIDIILKIFERSFLFRYELFDTWTYCNVLLPHALLIMNKSLEWKDKENNNRIIEIVSNLFLYLRNSLIPKQSKECLDLINKLISEDDEKYIENKINYYYLCSCDYENSGKYIDAIEILNTALKLSIKHNLKTEELSILNKIGTMYSSIDKHEISVKYYEEVIEKGEGLIDKESLIYAALLDSLGLSYKELNNLAKAKKYIEQAIDICDNYEQDDYIPEKCRALNLLGMVLYDYKDYEEAVIKCKEAYKLAYKIYGENHNKVALYIQNIGYCYDAMEKDSEATYYYEKAFEIFNNNDEYITKDRSCNLRNLAMIYDKCKSYEKAVEFYKLSIDMDILIFGKTSKDVLDGCLGLCLVYHSMGDIENFEDSYIKFINELKTSKNLNVNYKCNLALTGALLLKQKRCFDKALNLAQIAFESELKKKNNLDNALPLIIGLIQEINNLKKSDESLADLTDFEIKKVGMNNLGRNDKCPCGSGRKYKNCCLR